MNKFIWLLRREVWEARSIWIAPLICALIVSVLSIGSIIHSGHLQVDPELLAKLSEKIDPAKHDMYVAMALLGLGIPFFVTVAITQALYALDALFTERRDRSVLFWKSLPLSDTQTVLAKLATASVVMPLAGIAAMLVSQLLVVGFASALLPPIADLTTNLWSPSAWGAWLVFVGYIFVAATLWYLPTVAFLLLVSAWAPRSPFAIAALGPLALVLVERIGLGTHVVSTVLIERTFPPAFLAGTFGHRLAMNGGAEVHLEAKDLPSSIIDIVHPWQFLTSAPVWLGVAAAALMVAGAVWMRRYRDVVA